MQPVLREMGQLPAPGLPSDLGKRGDAALLSELTTQCGRRHKGHGTPGRAHGSQEQGDGRGAPSRAEVLEGRGWGPRRQVRPSPRLQTQVGPGPCPLLPESAEPGQQSSVGPALPAPPPAPPWGGGPALAAEGWTRGQGPRLKPQEGGQTL